MARTKKTNTKTTKAKATKTTKATKTNKSKNTVEVAATTTTTTTAAVAPAVPVVPTVDFSQLTTTLTSMTALVKTFKTQLKTLEKQVTKQTKELKKNKAKELKKKSNRQPSGFAKPSRISKQLCKFLNKPIDTEMARTEVTKHLTEYIKKHNLQNPENKKQIKPDTKLGKLLAKLQPEDQEKGYTYFNLQKYVKNLNVNSLI